MGETQTEGDEIANICLLFSETTVNLLSDRSYCIMERMQLLDILDSLANELAPFLKLLAMNDIAEIIRVSTPCRNIYGLVYLLYGMHARVDL